MAGIVPNSSILEDVFTPTRAGAESRLQSFIEIADGYAKGRNYDRPGNQAVSLLSPYLRHRIIAEREVVQQVLGKHDYKDVEKFVQEVSWRTYWKGYLEMRPGIWARYLKDVAYLESHSDSYDLTRYEQAITGETGIECFDHWTQQLISDGWLHNHVRMWYASIWIFTLKLPWQLGAAFFLQQLLDGDPASNTLSWRWVAGIHTKGKHYVARASNIQRYTEGRFNPEGELNEDASPLMMDGAYELQPFAKVGALRDINFPSLSCCPAGLLVLPEDLSPEFGELSETPFNSIAVFSGRDIYDGYKASGLVQSFVDAAVEDTAERLSSHWDGKVITCRNYVTRMVGKAGPDNVGRKERMRVYSGTVENYIDSVCTWAHNENLNSVWLMRPTVGPWADLLPELKKAMHARGVQVYEYRRRWDSLHWPHATSGYFRFKEGLEERIKRLLSAQSA